MKLSRCTLGGKCRRPTRRASEDQGGVGDPRQRPGERALAAECLLKVEPNSAGREPMNFVPALEFLDTLWSNYHRLAREVDLELMPCDSRDALLRNGTPSGR